MKIPRALLKDTITVKNFLGESAYGPQFDVERTVRCRVSYQNRLVKRPTGDDVISQATIDTDPDDVIAVGAQLTIHGSQMTAVEVRRPTGLNGKPLKQEVLVAP